MRAEAGLGDLEAQYRAVRETTDDAILILDERRRVESCNRASARIFNRPAAEIRGLGIDRLISGMARIGGSARVAAGRGEFVARGRGRDDFPVRVTVGEFSGEHGPRSVVIVHDISALRHTETELRQRERLLDQTIQHAPTGIATVDLEGRFRTVNKALCNMLGYSEAELIRRTVNGVTHPDDVAKEDAQLQRLRKGEIDEYEMRKRFVRKNGDVVESFMSACLVRDSEGRPLMCVGQVEDLTQRLNAEREAKENRDRLAQVTRLHTLGEMAAGIAHEINQPLTAISTYAQASRRLLEAVDFDREQLLRTQGKIILQAERAGDVIRRLRNFVRARSSDRSLVRVDQLVAETVQLAELDAESRGLTIQVDLQEPLPPVLADTVQIQQVVLNLLRNAMEAMDDPACAPREITLHARAADRESVEISVRDRGAGISAEVERQLFTTFFSTKSSGLGLGLTICRSILESHGGRLWFTRNDGRGITFHIVLPAVSGRTDDER